MFQGVLEIVSKLPINFLGFRGLRINKAKSNDKRRGSVLNKKIYMTMCYAPLETTISAL